MTHWQHFSVGNMKTIGNPFQTALGGLGYENSANIEVPIPFELNLYSI